MSADPALSVVLPSYLEEENLRVLLPRLGIFLLTTLLLGTIGGVLESNIVQGEYKAGKAGK